VRASGVTAVREESLSVGGFLWLRTRRRPASLWLDCQPVLAAYQLSTIYDGGRNLWWVANIPSGFASARVYVDDPRIDAP